MQIRYSAGPHISGAEGREHTMTAVYRDILINAEAEIGSKAGGAGENVSVIKNKMVIDSGFW